MKRTRLAALVLAHADAPQIRRLFGALPGVDLFLHCDRATPAAELRGMLAGFEDRVHLVPRRRTMLSSWSLVAVELQGIRTALENSDAEHIAVMSGACYPLFDVPALEAELEAFAGRTLLYHDPLPHEGWGTPRNPDGGLWRFNRRFLSFRGRPLQVHGMPIRALRQTVPRDLTLHAGSQWKVYARAHARRLIEIASSRPDLLRFFAHSFVPDESFVPTLLKSPELVGDVADQIANGSAWYMEWPSTPPRDHPEWLTPASFEPLRRARDGDRNWMRSMVSEVPVLFARKIGSATPELVQRIDAELRADSDPAPSIPAS